MRITLASSPVPLAAGALARRLPLPKPWHLPFRSQRQAQEELSSLTPPERLRRALESDRCTADQIRSIVADGVHFTFDTTGSNAVIRTAIASLAVGGTCGMVATPVGGVKLDGGVSLSGRCLRGIIEGDAVPQVFIPTLIELWRQGRFPFDQLITTFGLGDINAAEAAVTSGEAIKPVLVPG